MPEMQNSRLLEEIYNDLFTEAIGQLLLNNKQTFS